MAPRRERVAARHDLVARPTPRSPALPSPLAGGGVAGRPSAGAAAEPDVCCAGHLELTKPQIEPTEATVRGPCPEEGLAGGGRLRLAGCDARDLVREDTVKRRCAECGAEMGPWERRDSVPYACGLPNVLLMGAEVAVCPSCGADELLVRDPEGLHRHLAEAVAEKPAPLDAHELRFLRKHLGWSGKDLAGKIGYSHEQVSRWENGHAPIPVAVEQLLRAWVLRGVPPVTDYARHDGRTVSGVAFRARLQQDEWAVEPVAAK
jgi:putative zinc finger/helix-turn-helix YgiT family protein